MSHVFKGIKINSMSGMFYSSLSFALLDQKKKQQASTTTPPSSLHNISITSSGWREWQHAEMFGFQHKGSVHPSHKKKALFVTYSPWYLAIGVVSVVVATETVGELMANMVSHQGNRESHFKNWILLRCCAVFSPEGPGSVLLRLHGNLSCSHICQSVYVASNT